MPEYSGEPAVIMERKITHPEPPDFEYGIRKQSYGACHIMQNKNK